ncbi:mechanosensitive ion channel family protein [Prochlorothrix hollandica]|uniref:mechanosensitive ion channel family protein n=1 Tax=Prochlorothrix hollandica TaxID=1223 RepID=UPI001375C842|nr:mechanosensitive ion channel family protein [Prochlorothrix hollandica]
MGFCTWLWVMVLALPGWGQTPFPLPFSTLGEKVSEAVQSEGVDVGYVRLDGRNFFLVSAPKLTTDQPWQLRSRPIKERISAIELNLQQFKQTGFELDSLTVTYQFLNGLPVIYGNETLLLTVTKQDANLYGVEPEDRAETLVAIVAQALKNAVEERQPEFLRQQARIGLLLALGTLGLSGLVWVGQRYLSQQERILTHQEQALKITMETLKAERDERDPLTILENEGEDKITGDSSQITSLVAMAQTTAENRRLYSINEIKRRVLQLVQFLIWGGSFYGIVGLFPQTRFLQLALRSAVRIPLQLLSIAIATYLLIRIIAILISRLLWELEDSRLLSPEASKRLILRISTFSQVLKRISAIMLTLTGILLGLATLGLPIGPILAGAGIFGLAISFASQSVIKDAINGILILLEDQYGVGDVIEVGSLAGLVETMDLRITQLRDAEGCLITIPNGEIRAVKNRSKEWSRVDLNIPVPYDANLTEMMGLLETVALRMRQDLQWQGLILEAPQLMGVEDFSDRGVVLKVWIKTQPLKQWDVAREYRRRVKTAFDQRGIVIPIPQQALWVKSLPTAVPSTLES